MSAPILWIGIPGLFALAMFFLGRWPRIIIILGIGVCIWVSTTAWILPIDQPIQMGSNSIKINESLRIMGRDFVMENADRPFVSLVYGLTAVWILGAYIVGSKWWFVPLSIGIIALLVAAITVEPFLFAALIIEIAALLIVPLLSPPDQKPGKGIYRFLVFQTLGMPFILFSGWMLAGAEVGSANLDLIIRAGVVLGIGFAFLMAVLPFHSWIPMVAEESEPFVTAFVLFFFPGMISLFGLSFLDRFVWLRESDVTLGVIQVVGIIMVVGGGLWAASANHLGKMFGFNVVVEIGFTLLAISLASRIGILLFFWLFFSKAFPYIFWSVGLSLIAKKNNGDLSLDSVKGLIIKNPIIAWVIIVSQLSMCGLPLFASFPVRYGLLIELAKENIAIVFWILVGIVGLLIGTLRLIVAFYSDLESDVEHSDEEGNGENRPFDPEEKQRKNLSYLALIAVLGVLFWLGLFPQNMISIASRMLEMYIELGS